MALNVLKAKQVEHAKAGDKLSDGGGLRLDVDAKGNAAWTFRFTSPVHKKERFMGLGPLRDVTLEQARDAAAGARALVRKNIDPIDERKEQRTAAKVEEQRSVTFKAFAEQYVAAKESGWKHPRHRQIWRNSLRDYVFPTIGHLPVADVTTDNIVALLQPIWLAKRETAARVRGRVEMIMGAAMAATPPLRTDNPALLAILKHRLPEQNRKQHVQHHDALPYAEMPAFWKSLAADTSDAARMLRWIALTACRYGEANGIDAREIKGDVWTVPAARMKTGKEHVVPLTPLALEQWPFRPVSDPALATCIRRHTSTKATTHGFRSTFRDWAGDATDFPRELAEAALAHTLGEVERAYRRGTALAKRRELMTAWAAYCVSTDN
jgi:integrase